MNLRILYQDEYLVAIDKPAGFHVHPPEKVGDIEHRIPRGRNCLHILSRQLNRYLYPVHRLDGGTSGVVLFALTPEMTADIGRLFSGNGMTKTYYCVTRGWVTPDGLIDHPLDEKPSQTAYQNMAGIELPVPVGRYPTSRYSLVRALPLSGRMHQIRRHLAHLSHPLIGDSVYGDGKHNRFFREKFGRSALLLKAHSLEFTHPLSGQRVRIESRWGKLWHQIFDMFGFCPRENV